MNHNIKSKQSKGGLPLFKNRQEAINKRQEYLEKNPMCFKGNTIQRRDYVAALEGIELTAYQFDLVVGMLLSDASVDFNATGCRIKMQQSYEHRSWLESTRFDLVEYTASNSLYNTKRSNSDMYESDTLTCNAFDQVIDLFYENKSTPKIIKPEIQPYITEVSVANWFCGDGGKRSHDTDKAIEFNTQGFKQTECEYLAEILTQNLQIDAESVRDSHLKRGEKYIVRVKNSSYDTFIEKVGPYIHPCFIKRLPPPRSYKSRFGFMTPDLFSEIIGSKLVGDYNDTYKRPNYQQK